MSGLVLVTLVAAAVSCVCSVAAIVVAVSTLRLQRDLARRREALRQPSMPGQCGGPFLSPNLRASFRCGRPLGHDGACGVMKPSRPPSCPSGVSLSADGRSR